MCVTFLRDLCFILQDTVWCLLEQFHLNRVLLSVHLISLDKKHGLKCFRDLFEIKHTEFFYSCIFLLPYIVISEIGIRFSITDLFRTKFMFY